MNNQQLGQQVKAKRQREGLTITEAAHQTGLSEATIARIQCGAVIDVSTFFKLSQWLGISTDGAVCYYPSKPLPEIVADLIDADDDIPFNAKPGLKEFFAQSYATFAGQR